jgi:hypothetical protein
VSINVAAKGEVDFVLVYEELLTRKLGVYEQVFNIDPGQLVFDLSVRVRINETRPLSKVHVPAMQTGNEITTSDDRSGNSLATITKTSDSLAVITYSPTKDDQM